MDKHTKRIVTLLAAVSVMLVLIMLFGKYGTFGSLSRVISIVALLLFFWICDLILYINMRYLSSNGRYRFRPIHNISRWLQQVKQAAK